MEENTTSNDWTDELTPPSWTEYAKLAAYIVAGIFLCFVLIILALRWVNPSFSAFTLQEDWVGLEQERYSLRESWVPADELPEHLKLAVVASEDQRFYEHWGLDLAAIEQALEEKEKEGRVRGASTITQQVAKNLFLWPAQSYFRKGIEAGIAVMIELLWTKDRILEVYLNIAEFGPGMYGVAKAGAHYYGKKPAQFTPEQSARMATVLPNPKRIEPEPASSYVIERSRWILRNMQQLSGYIYLPEQDSQPENEADTAFSDIDSTFFSYPDESIPVKTDSLSVNNLTDTLIQNVSADTLDEQLK
ncbi:monofunctional biosynthetic peptidoglycan transglycosylase [Gracilimonas mengyeensis]|uniref:Biosynthetic peptidoglycan transglycosylase n=1 Tax=Gracilimonas mengyeensis TaxID=1302730 RepID=A0A521ER68_9BACT|nr:monofunctional biosynthetic peptidoglycan transglycosylase [Gracilimonas mengyeensis]SMO85911.1 monofunctional biosynthetic peptidoglycan transglycosylase [Gracilimonas mengyeensis]